MNSKFVRLTALFALLSAFVLGGCENLFESPKARSSIPAGKGVVRIAIAAEGAKTARTAMATEAFFHRYEYWFAKGGGEPVQETDVEGVFELDPGSYTVTVKAFVSAEAEGPAAQGTSAAFAIAAGADAGAVSVALTPVLGEGQGSFAFSLSYPEGATLESLTLTRLGGTESFDLMLERTPEETLLGKVFSGEQAGVGAGYWLAQASLSSSQGGYTTHAGRSEVAHIYKDGSTALEWVFEDSEFAAIPVLSAEDSGPGTLREALERSAAGDGATIFIDLPGDKVITLKSPLPAIAKGLTIAGNGATLTQSGIAPGAETQFLRISASATVRISRLRFTGGRTTGRGAALSALSGSGALILESCIFSDNQAVGAVAGSEGGAVATYGSSLTVLGCTFYHNSAYRGGAIARRNGTVTLTGNLFFGNTASSSNPLIYGTVTSGGYNVSDKASGTNTATGSGYTGLDSDRFSVTTFPISPVSFKPVAGRDAAGLLPSPLPDSYPAADFYGRPVAERGAAGAAQELLAAPAYALDYGAINAAYGTVSSDPPPDENGFYSGSHVTLTAAPGTPDAAFSHWTVNGATVDTNPLSLAIDANKIVRAVFGRAIRVTDSGDSAAAGTLRSALANAQEYDLITLPPKGTITLTAAPLPEIALSLSILGNGATLTQSGITPGAETQFLRIAVPGAPRISRLRFTGGRTTGNGGAIYNQGNLTLESCIFSDNEARQGGAVFHATNSSGKILGCTFYNNNAAGSVPQGGAMYTQSPGNLTVTGNLFFGNTAPTGNVIHASVSSVSHVLYSVSDKAYGTDAATGSGYSGLSNRFDAPLPLGRESFKPLKGRAAAGILPSPLPDSYPAEDFYGQPIAPAGAAGAVQTLLEEYCLDYSVNNTAFGTVTPSVQPGPEGAYAFNQAVTLTAAATNAPDVTFSYWTLNGEKQTGPSLALVMNAHHSVQAVFARNIAVSDSSDGAGSAEAPTLRYALTTAEDGDIITLPAGGAITLSSPLPAIAKSLTIAGNGATLSSTSTGQLLNIEAAATTVKISRLHFKGGGRTVSASTNAITSRAKSLVLESCIFSDNQTTTGTGAEGGAVRVPLAGSDLTVLGCTFYRNAAYRGGAISKPGTPAAVLTGNLFAGNIGRASQTSQNIYYYGANGAMALSGGYNVADTADGVDDSGYLGVAGDLFEKAWPLSPLGFKPITGDAAAGRLPASLPAGYPAVDFYGQPISAGGAAGAVQELTASGCYLDYSVSHDAYGTVHPPAPRADGLYDPSASLSLTAAETAVPGAAFSHWTVNGETVTSNPLSLVMNAHKTVRAVFARNFVVSDPGDGDGSAEAPTLRYAVTNAIDGDSIDLPAGGTITLTKTLPKITKSIDIRGNGATLTMNYKKGTDTQLLRFENSPMDVATTGAKEITISRLHFKSGRTTASGSTLYNTRATITLKSCIFSDNESSTMGGAIFTQDGKLTVLGCTFFNNRSLTDKGGAIYISAGTNVLEGNLFFANTATGTNGGGNVVYVSGAASLESHGYNVSDKAAGADPATGSGYTGLPTDVFNLADIVFATEGDPATKPSSGTSLKTLTALSEGFPTTYFDGTPRDLPATAGAVASGTKSAQGTNTITLVFKEDDTLIDGNTENLSIDRSEGQTLAVKAAEGLTDIQWSLNGVKFSAPRGTAATITIEAANYPAGEYQLTLAAKKKGADYSVLIAFTVEE